MRLQAAALKSLSEDGTVDITTILKLAHHFTSLNVCQNDGESSVNSLAARSSCTNQINHSQLENGTTGLFEFAI